MWFMSWIIYRLNDVGAWFYALYLDAWSAFYIPAVVSGWFHTLSGAFYALAGHFADLDAWIVSVRDKILNVLDWPTIWSTLTSWIPNLAEISDWFYSWYFHVQGVVLTWWAATMADVMSWISAAETFLQVQVNAAAGAIAGLEGRWSNFWAVTWPGIPDWFGIGDLINTRTEELAPFWAGWADWRPQILEFIESPLDWIVSRFESWFWGE